MSNPNRRTMLQILGSAPVAAGFAWTEAEAQQAHEQAHAATQEAAKKAAPYSPKFFTRHEYATVNVLVDIIIPKDDRSKRVTTS